MGKDLVVLDSKIWDKEVDLQFYNKQLSETMECQDERWQQALKCQQETYRELQELYDERRERRKLISNFIKEHSSEFNSENGISVNNFAPFTIGDIMYFLNADNNKRGAEVSSRVHGWVNATMLSDWEDFEFIQAIRIFHEG